MLSVSLIFRAEKIDLVPSSSSFVRKRQHRGLQTDEERRRVDSSIIPIITLLLLVHQSLFSVVML